MIRIIQRPNAETTVKPSYCICPHCNGQVIFFHSNPIICSTCSQPLEIRYLDLLKFIGYRLEFHFSKG